MNANFGLVEPLETPVNDKMKKKEALAGRALRDMGMFAKAIGCSQAEAPFTVGTP